MVVDVEGLVVDENLQVGQLVVTRNPAEPSIRPKLGAMKKVKSHL
jgi:hypothetical protein